METYVVHLTKICNLDCFYCYEVDKSSKYSWKEIKKFIDDIVKFRTSDTFNIEFLGGEPLLAFDFLKKSVEYLENMKIVNVKSYFITTNGTIMNEEIISFLKSNPKVQFAASMDGNKHSNQLRVFKDNRKNSYEAVINNLKLMISEGLKPAVHMVSHPYNVGMIAVSIDHLYDQGVRYIDVGTVESTMIIDQAYCDRFVFELKLIADAIHQGKYPGLSIGLFNWLKPNTDVRTYIRDKDGKLIGETYGRSGDDVSVSKDYKIIRCSSDMNPISDMIYNIRREVYEYYNRR